MDTYVVTCNHGTVEYARFCGERCESIGFGMVSQYSYMHAFSISEMLKRNGHKKVKMIRMNKTQNMGTTMKIIELPEGTILVTKGGKAPYFTLSTCNVKNIDKTKVKNYLYNCDWTDRNTPGYIVPHLDSRDFMKKG